MYWVYKLQKVSNVRDQIFDFFFIFFCFIQKVRVFEIIFWQILFFMKNFYTRKNFSSLAKFINILVQFNVTAFFWTALKLRRYNSGKKISLI